MPNDRIRRYAREVPVVAVVTVTAVLATLLLAHDSGDASELLRSSQMVAYPLLLGAAVLVYFHWRMASSSVAGADTARRAGWLTVGLILASLHSLVQATLLDSGATGRRDEWPLIGQITALVVLILVAHVAERADVPGDPALVGVVAGLALSACTCAAVAFAPPLVVSPTSGRLLATSAVVTGLVLAWTLLHRTTVSPWARHRLALSTVLVTTAQSVRYADLRVEVVVAAAVLSCLLGSAVVCTMTHVLFRRSVAQHQRELALLHETLAQTRAAVLTERELLHEVGATVAGITTASSVMRQGPLLPPQRRARLERMVEAELARLNRLMGERTESGPREIDVDAIVEPLVTSHQERGLEVSWQPSSIRAVGDPDAFAEVVNILLENARRHGRGRVRLEATASAGQVEVTCADEGPGVARDVRDQIFTSGVRGADSCGQGLGLAIAQRLMTERGGSLDLLDSTEPGATFVARLPMSEMSHVTPHHCA